MEIENARAGVQPKREAKLGDVGVAPKVTQDNDLARRVRAEMDALLKK